MLQVNGLIGFGGGGKQPLRIALSAGSAAVNLRTLANAAGYTGETDRTITFTLASGTMVSNDAAVPTITRGSFGAGCAVILVNRGAIKGKGGQGGAGGTCAGSIIGSDPTSGQQGGTAIDATGGPISIDNTGASVEGGSTGGAGSSASIFEDHDTGQASCNPGNNGDAGADGGGGGGLYAVGSANITWVANGTRLGSFS